MNIVDKVSELITKQVEEKGYKTVKVKLCNQFARTVHIEIVNIEYLKEDGIYYLRIIIDNVSPITVDDCVIVSKIVNPILDEADLITDNYILDVCSK